MIHNIFIKKLTVVWCVSHGSYFEQMFDGDRRGNYQINRANS